MSYQPPPPPSDAGAPYPASSYQSYGYTAYPAMGPGGSPMSLKGLSVALMVLFPIAALAAVITAIEAFNRASVVSDLLTHSVSDVQDADSAVSAGAGFYLVTVLAIAVVFIIWQYRHAKNAERLAGKVSPGSGWAIGGWFIPLANYIIPELQLFRSAAASDPDAAPPAGRAPQVVVAWWVLWATGALLFAVGRSMHPSGDVTFGNLSDKADQFANGDRVMAVGLLLTAAAAVLAMVMVRTLSARQELALSRRGSQPPQPWQQQPQQPWQQPAQPQSWQQPQAWPPQPQPQPQSWQPQPPPQQWPPAPQPPAQQWPPAPQPQPPPPPQQWPPASPPPDPSVPS